MLTFKQETTTQDVVEPQHDGSVEAPTEPVEGESEERDANESTGQALAVKDQNGDGEDGDAENYDGETANGNFQTMGFQGSGDFNQMQMMMAMQNGMGSNAFGGFPMMGRLPTPRTHVQC